jgi:hypothetical protein
MAVRHGIMKIFAASAAMTAALGLVTGTAYGQVASQTQARVVQVSAGSSAHAEAADRTAPKLLATIVLPVQTAQAREAMSKSAAQAPANHTGSYSLTDACGGVNGDVLWQGFDVQIWGEVWGNPPYCGGSGQHSVWLSFVYLNYLGGTSHFNKGYGYANPGQTVGFNSGLIDPLNAAGFLAGITVTLCSSVGSWHCGPSKSF